MRRRVVLPVMILFILSILLTLQPAFGQGDSGAIEYGQTVTGTISAAKYSVFYAFAAMKGDVITVVMTRKSGNLKPVIALADPTAPEGQMIIKVGTLSGDGKTATISKYKIAQTGAYVLLASRVDVDKGITTGQFTLTLSKAGGSTTTTQKTPTPTIKPRKATATPVVQASGDYTDAIETFEVGQLPTCIATTDEYIFVCNYLDSTISVLDLQGEAVNTIDIGGAPTALGWDGARLWVSAVPSSGVSDSVSVFDTKGKKAGTYKVGGEAHGFSYDADSQQMWISVWSAKQIVAVNPKGKIVATLDTEKEPEALVWTGSQLWATLLGTSKAWNNQVAAVDSDAALIDTYTVGKGPMVLAWNEADEILYVANYASGTVSLLDADGKLLDTYRVGLKPGGLAWDGSELWVALTGDNAVVALDSEGNEIANIPFEQTPGQVAWDGTSIWVTNEGTFDEPGTTVTRIDVEAALAVSQ